ncbi:hypothetical protein ACFYO1_02625 [Nocardia sp. NPDC006044]|uniref:hypothetical protein n=1 Tax=Nocardia sp. NPDC006044 TaxID=3364306 RepID=UPI003695355A
MMRGGSFGTGFSDQALDTDWPERIYVDHGPGSNDRGGSVGGSAGDVAGFELISVLPLNRATFDVVPVGTQSLGNERKFAEMLPRLAMTQDGPVMLTGSWRTGGND